MKADELRRRYLDFFVKKHLHAEIPGASLIPEHDPSVLFTTAGMHPLIPYLMGEKHPAGKRLVNCQKCLRTDDIDEVGDLTHLTFFEMLGNWSLGDPSAPDGIGAGYFKEEAIKMSFEFLTSPLEKGGLGLEVDHLSISCFAGDQDAPKDEESPRVWQSLGIPKERIYFYGKKENWWGPAGNTGPCGPDTEMFYDTGKPKCGSNCEPRCNCGKFSEIWNDVFMEYHKTAEGKYLPLKQKNVDTGMGLERTLAVLQGKENLFEIELFAPIIEKIRKLEAPKKTKISGEEIIASERIIADHLRAASFVLGDELGIVPSNTDRGYILRRLIRRAIRHGRKLGIEGNFTSAIGKIAVEIYGDSYPELKKNAERIFSELEKEEKKFQKTLHHGEKEFEKMLAKIKAGREKVLGGKEVFHLYDTYGFPLEMTKELAKEQGLKVDEKGFEKAFLKHQELSRAGAKQKFKGGLAEFTEQTTRLHTATHLLHQALRDVLGPQVKQMGSNITAERLRFDFPHPEKLTPEQIRKVEEIVNEKIKADLLVKCEEMTLEEAKKKGAIGLFEAKYGEKVKVYSLGDYSQEICGGPHVKSTGELKRFKIIKEESCASGVRRIKAVVGR